jgi:hypothetical protein
LRGYVDFGVVGAGGVFYNAAVATRTGAADISELPECVPEEVVALEDVSGARREREV